MCTGTGEVWSDGDKVPRAVSGISDESSDGDGAETENAGECNPLSDIPYQDIPRQAKTNQSETSVSSEHSSANVLDYSI